MNTHTKNLEKEVRYYFPNNELEKIKEVANKTGLILSGRFHEITTMYDNPNDRFSFYSKEIDGRLRFRITTDTTNNSVKSKISWKRRLPEFKDSEMNIEEEIEVDILQKDIENINFIFNKVLQCPLKSSYERFRTVYLGSGVELTIDEFPYGIMVEIEVKEGTEEDLDKVIAGSYFKDLKSSKKSCDDTYRDLCIRDGISESAHILFSDTDMPQIKN